MATATPANGACTTSPAASCGIHCKVLDMKPNDRRIVQASPDARSAVSEVAMYLVMALLRSPLATALLDSSTTCRTPAWRARARVVSRSG
jgi:hypothetical protein